MKFRKKPVEIEAMRFLAVPKGIDGKYDAGTLLKWLEKNKVNFDFYGGSAEIKIHTLEGIMTASLGDWIIKGVKGEFYPCKPDIFELTYEPAD